MGANKRGLEGAATPADVIRGLTAGTIDGFADCTIEELRALNRVVVDEIKMRRNDESRRAVRGFKPGDKVRMRPEHGTRRLPASVTGKVVRTLQTNVLVDFGSHRTWKIPATMIEAASKGGA